MFWHQLGTKRERRTDRLNPIRMRPGVYEIQQSPISDNLTPQESTKQDTQEMCAGGVGLSCPGSSGVADADDESRKCWIVASFTDMMGCSIVTVPSYLMS